MSRKPEVYLTDTIETWRQKTNLLSANIGDPDDLNTTDKTTLVSAINELESVSNSSFTRDQLSVSSSGTGAHSSLSYNKNSGVFSFTVNSLTPSDIPELDASKVPTGVFNADQIPNLDASKITTGIFDSDRFPESIRNGIGLNNTDDLDEGLTNLYFTTDRARASIVAGSNITYDPNTGVISSTGGLVNVDPDYDEVSDRSNSWAAYSLQSMHFFLDHNNSETGNYFGIYNNLDPYSDTVNSGNSIFRVDEDGSVNVTNTLHVSTNGIEFPSDAYGGSGDTAKIYLGEADDGAGEATRLTFEVSNDLEDEIHFILPSANGVKINGFTAYHEGNLAPAGLTPNVAIVREAFIETIQNSGVYYFNSSQYPNNVNRPPDEHEIILVCKVPEHGYSPGDEIYFSQQSSPEFLEEGIVITRHNNSLLMQMRIGQNGPGLVTNKNSGTGHVLQSANWSVKVRFIWWGSDGNYTKGVTDWLANPSSTGTVTIEGDLTGNATIEVPGTFSFGTVSVSGQSDVVSSSAGDTLNLIGGSGVTITTNGSDSITISSSGGGGGLGSGQVWQDVLSSRVSGVVYQNSTGASIMVSITALASVPQVSSVSSSGPWITLNTFGPVNTADGASFIVPNGHWYRIETSTIVYDWVELR